MMYLSSSASYSGLQPQSLTRSSVLHPIAHLDHDLFEIEFIEAAPPPRKVLFLQGENFPLFFIAQLPYGGMVVGAAQSFSQPALRTPRF